LNEQAQRAFLKQTLPQPSQTHAFARKKCPETKQDVRQLSHSLQETARIVTKVRDEFTPSVLQLKWYNPHFSSHK
jgi:hypothetical protein